MMETIFKRRGGVTEEQAPGVEISAEQEDLIKKQVEARLVRR